MATYTGPGAANSLLRSSGGEADAPSCRYWDEPFLVAGAIVAARALLELLVEPLPPAHARSHPPRVAHPELCHKTAPQLPGNRHGRADARLAETGHKEPGTEPRSLGRTRDDLIFASTPAT